jgi:hypothetical protein
MDTISIIPGRGTKNQISLEGIANQNSWGSVFQLTLSILGEVTHATVYRALDNILNQAAWAQRLSIRGRI